MKFDGILKLKTTLHKLLPFIRARWIKIQPIPRTNIQDKSKKK